MQTKMISRNIARLVRGIPTQDGAGVNLTRIITQDLQKRLDPFLMLDAFNSNNPKDYLAGFPDHPHRGFETVTYMLHGRMRHFDNHGHEGVVEDGGVQWMTAGKGLIHSEMPEQKDGLMEGFQLWLNLPADQKMSQPWYRDISSDEIPSVAPEEGVNVRVIAGEIFNTAGAIQKKVTEPLYLDVAMHKGTQLFFPINNAHNAFIYIYKGSALVGSQEQSVNQHNMIILSGSEEENGIQIKAEGPVRFLLISGRPLNDPIVQWGPFVMNTEEEIASAIDDYRSGNM